MMRRGESSALADLIASLRVACQLLGEWKWCTLYRAAPPGKERRSSRRPEPKSQPCCVSYKVMGLKTMTMTSCPSALTGTTILP
jgi:hypothetical protein